MNDDTVFLMRGDAMTELRQTPYEQEALLQKALASFPEIIAGPTTVEGGTPGLVLVKREMGVPRADGGSAAFSLDHLFIDAEGVPVLVEVKRSSDTRIRREVVGQMLDYVANAVAYWPVADLRDALEKSAADSGKSALRQVSDITDMDVEEFWRTVENNLRSGRVRLLFVADVLPPELVRVIEFLNEQMSPAEVLGVELRQYVSDVSGEDHSVLVPRVIGRTSAAVATKVRATGGQVWNYESFLDYAATTTDSAGVDLVRQVVDDAAARGTTLRWGKGQSASVGGYQLVAGHLTRMWIIQLGLGVPGDPARLELMFKPLALRLADSEPALGRLARAADLLGQFPKAAARVEESRAAGWLVSKRIPLSELTEDPSRTQHVLDAVRALGQPAS